MSDLSGYGEWDRIEAFDALVDDVISRTGCPPLSVVTVLDEGGIGPDSAELLDRDRCTEIAHDTVVLLDIAGHRRDYCIATERLNDMASIVAMRGLRLGTTAGAEEQLIARVAYASGQGANAAVHAIYTLPVPRAWLSDETKVATVEALAMLAFAPTSETHH